jgi:hypothetical protein
LHVSSLTSTPRCAAACTSPSQARISNQRRARIHEDNVHHSIHSKGAEIKVELPNFNTDAKKSNA